jgi:hypothetical protein
MLVICNTYCFSTATTVARTRLSFTLCVHCRLSFRLPFIQVQQYCYTEKHIMYTNNNSYYLTNLKPKFSALWIYSVITNIYKPSTTALVHIVCATNKSQDIQTHFWHYTTSVFLCNYHNQKCQKTSRALDKHQNKKSY